MFLEVLRRSARRVLTPDSRIYQALASTLDAHAVVRKEGVGTWRALRRMGSSPPSPPVRLDLRSLDHPFHLRPGTADVLTTIQNVAREEYGDFEMENPQWAVDAGAYIGDTSAYLLSRFPSLKVVALEPNPESYALAERNLRPYGDRAVLVRKGLWGEDARLGFGGETINAGVRDGQPTIDCVSVPTLLKTFGLPRIDILKMDIEGAERSVFESNPAAWLHRVGLVIVETHGQDCHAALKRAMDACGFTMRRYRSLWYCQKG